MTSPDSPGSSDVGSTYQLGIQAAQSGDLETAIAAFRAVLAEDSNHIEARYKLGWALGSQGYLDPALVIFSEVLERDPDHRAARYNSGAILLQKAQLESPQPGEMDPEILRQAEALFGQLLEQDPFDQRTFAMLNLIRRALETIDSEKTDPTDSEPSV